ncbi:MAG: energy transducer TonB [Sphingomicrobium sp.]|nr:energy transducer TonB [Sphingomonadales bacterium]
MFALLISMLGSQAAPTIVETSAPVIAQLRGSLPVETFFSRDDYPAAALQKSEQGAVAVNLTINPQGRVSECVVVETSHSSALDEATCSILARRARYIPPLDNHGEPTIGTATARIVWALPRSDQRPTG